MPYQPAANKMRYTFWLDRDLLSRWKALHDKGRAAPALVRLIEAEVARLEGEGGPKTAESHEANGKVP